jgi:hypothetical protein
VAWSGSWGGSYGVQCSFSCRLLVQALISRMSGLAYRSVLSELLEAV